MPRFARLPLILFIFSLIACSEDQSQNEVEIAPVSAKNYIETGDLKQIRKHKKLRILTAPLVEQWLPRKGDSFSREQDLAIKLAQQLNLKPVFIQVEKFEDLIPALQQGRGDIIDSYLTVTDERKQQIAFTLPLTQSREHIVSRKNESINSLKQLNKRSIAYQAETSFVQTIQQLKSKQPKVNVQVMPGHLNQDQIIDQLVSKQIDLTIMDSSALEILKSYRDDFSVQLALTQERALAWGVRKDSTALLEEINQFLTHQQLTHKAEPLYTDDFQGIKKRKTLRIITRNNAASYFLWRGELLGFEYDLAKKFADKHGLRIEMITAPSHDEQIPMLLEGKGDIIASFMTITENRKNKGVAFSRPHHKTRQLIVSRKDDKIISAPEDLAGRSIYVRHSSAYWDALMALQKSGIHFKLFAAPENMETEEIIEKVALGEYDLTLADEHLVNIELTWRTDIRANIALGEEQENAWILRNNNPQLMSAVNQFLKEQYRSLYYNVTYKKYFKNPRRIKKYRSQRIDLQADGTLSPYDNLVKKYAADKNLDWRLLVAQMYQESRFDPKAESWVGAKGLMQVMPRTAKEIGITNLEDPESGIKAGIKYLDWVRDRFEPELNIKDRMWMTLAAYNAGYGHVRDARRLAKNIGLNPNRWFNNVEKAILLLSKREYYSKARHGYVRGKEPVNYVREIRQRYQAYLAMSSSGE